MSLLAAIFTCAGLLLILSQDRLVRHWTGAISVFAAGMLLVSVFTHYLPEGLTTGNLSGLICLGGFVFGLLLRTVPATASGLSKSSRADIWAGILGIGLHSFIDGGIYALSFENGVSAGISATLPLIVHELAEGMIAFVLLASAFSKRTAIIGTILIAALTTPFGALILGVFFDGVIPSQIWILQAFNAGLLIYLATVLLLRPLLLADSPTSVRPLLLGVGAGLLLFFGNAYVSDGAGHGHSHMGHDHGDPDRVLKDVSPIDHSGHDH